MSGADERAAASYGALNAALADTTPPCSGDPRFILEPHEIAPAELMHLRGSICFPCPLRSLCAAYAEEAWPPAGIWAGRMYRIGSRRPVAPAPTDE